MGVCGRRRLKEVNRMPAGVGAQSIGACPCRRSNRRLGACRVRRPNRAGLGACPCRRPNNRNKERGAKAKERFQKGPRRVPKGPVRVSARPEAPKEGTKESPKFPHAQVRKPAKAPETTETRKIADQTNKAQQKYI